jgi:hypothetical protein
MTRRRFTDADKWEDDWFMNLSREGRELWQYMCDRCDLAGVWEPSQRFVAFHLGMTVNLSDARAWFGDRVEQLSDGKWRLVKFIQFQHPGGLNPRCKAHVPVIARLTALNLPIPIFNPIDSLSNGYGRATDSAQEEDKTTPSPSDSSFGGGCKGEPKTPSKADFIRWLHRNTLAADTDALVEQWIGIAIKAGAPKDSAGPIDWALRIERLRVCCAQAKRINGKCTFPSHAEPFARQVKEQLKPKEASA